MISNEQHIDTTHNLARTNFKTEVKKKKLLLVPVHGSGINIWKGVLESPLTSLNHLSNPWFNRKQHQN
jgi:hypothetical protein